MKRWLMALALACTCSSVSFAQGPSEASILLFDKAKATKERIDKGAVFIDGRFIRAPYTVTRQGNFIFVNGLVAAHLKVEGAKDEEATQDEASKEAADVDATATDETTSTEETSSEETAEEVALPQRRPLTRAEKEAAAKEKSAAMFKRGGVKSLKEKEAERKKAAMAKPKPAFNQEASSSNPDALFEEADYTYTPPSKAEPGAVRYIRPAPQKSLKEKAAEQAAEKAARQAAEAEEKAAKMAEKSAKKTTTESSPTETEVEADDDAEAIAIEMLTEEEAMRYKAELEKRHKQIEEVLQKDGMAFLSSTGWGWKQLPKATMQKFILSLEKPGKWEAFSKQWKTLPQQYLRKIYDQREENAKESKTLRMKIQREQRDVKNKPSRI